MAFTIHGLDNELDRKLTERARREGTSKNRLVKKLLARAMGLRTGEQDTDDYREFLGTWTDEDLREFEKGQELNTRVDAEDWE